MAVVSVVIHGNVSDIEAEESAAASASLVPAVDTGGKFLFILFIFLDTDPHLASVVCVPLSLFRFEIRVVCVWELVYVCACEHKFGVATNHGKF
jgi:hypothetical protein